MISTAQPELHSSRYACLSHVHYLVSFMKTGYTGEGAADEFWSIEGVQLSEGLSNGALQGLRVLRVR